MDSSKKYDIPSPEETANPLSKLFFIWILPFFKYGYKNDIQVKDLFNASETDKSNSLGNDIESIWDQEVEEAAKNKQHASLLKVIRRTYIKSYSLYGIILFLQCAGLKMLLPIVLAEYIKYYDTTARDRDPASGWSLGMAVVFIAFANVVIAHFCSLGTQRIGMRCRIAVCSLIYRKLLKLNRTSLGQVAVGKLINLLSNDVQRFDIAALFWHYIWIMPIQTALASYVLYRNVGLAGLSGLGAITLQAIPLQGHLSRLQGKYRGLIAQRTDNRVKLMNEITSGMQVIKMYAWEKPFEKVVALARKYEIDVVTKTSYIRGFSLALMVFTERATVYLTLITFVLMGNRLSGNIVFPVAQLFNTIQLYMCILYPNAMSTYAEAKTSVKRIEEFLHLDEKSPEMISDEKNEKISNEKVGTIQLSKACASWTPNPIVNTLMDLNFEIRPGSLCCVVGSVGAGKSSFLQVLLKELPLNMGKMSVTGRISYSSQEPWLFVSSIRNNILFGQEYSKLRYRQTVRVCALERDFELFPHGDKTLVGERGTSLSGGQRARVNLARAVYRDADIYLFDDPLSAVDTHVGKHLFEECIVKHLEGKTRVLVTHQLQYLRQADVIIVLNNGKVEKIGTYSDLSENELNNLNQEHNQSVENLSKEEEIQIRTRLTSVTSKNSTVGDEDEVEEPTETQELMEKGKIPSSTYMKYFKAGGTIPVLLFLVFLLIIAQVACNASDIWLTYWTNMEELRWNRTYHDIQNVLDNLNPTTVDNTSFLPEVESTTVGNNFTTDVTSTMDINIVNNRTYRDIQNVLDNLNSTIAENMTSTPEIELTTVSNNFTTVLNSTVDVNIMSQDTYIWIYSVLIAFSIILMTARSFLYFKLCMNASKNLHNLMFSNILQATMRFFDTNPSGRILNRFSKDMGAIDEILPKSLIEALQIFLVMSGILAMVFIKTPWMIVPAIVLGGLFSLIRAVYLASSQDVKRLEGLTRAPVFSHVTASVYGLPTIRASHAQDMIIKEFDLLQDQHTSSWFIFLSCSEAFGLYLDIISSFFLAMVTLQFLVFNNENVLSGDVGLVISQSLILTGMVQYGIRQSTEVASNMISVERVLQYTKLDKEGPFQSLPAKKPAREWPQNGQIVFKNVYLRYVPEDPPVLKNLNIEIKAGEKVGIVGRTGAGKSTLIASLFRLTQIDGTVEIDGVDTKDIGLNDLRSKISIIPQEPVLFSNTIRYNLDPFEKCDDKTLWEALENVELKDAIDSLDQNVNEGGSNFSAGQRQLVCLARAVVRNNKVLVMDEATANVDHATDTLIQQAIRRNFKDCTVLTIAHRLNTIMDSDKVLVMDAGQAVEFDHPHILLQINDGYFTKMVKETGVSMESKLRKVAKDDYDEKYGQNDTTSTKQED